jgi:orotate phosphoribosyltransferase
MHAYQSQFIEFCLNHDIIQLGDFTLKSGRKSPYFFNAGLFNTGQKIQKLSEFYAEAILAASLEFDILFGPAYKGIPLVVSTAMTLASKTNQPIPFCFNRKVAKDHGEGGSLVGSPLQGKVLLIDDVITAGTAIHESMHWIHQQNAQLSSIIIALDRQEKGQNHLSAIEEIKKQYQIPVHSIIKFEHLVEYIEGNDRYQTFMQPLKRYRNQYGTP